jgi:ABC-2 type transport system ATP-binding protein
VIETTELTKRYGDKLAVDHLTMSIPSGQVTGFLGPNGAGKSTTMRMILDLDSPTSGSAKVNGRRYRDIRFPLHEVGSLLEAKSVHPARTARGHLQWLADSNRIPRKRVDEVLELVGLSAVAKKRAGGFSLGMGQRLGIAAAMLGDPQTLLLDEPVNGLDPEGIVWVRSFLRSLAAEGRTVLVSSHLMSEMALTADHLIVIGAGRLISQGSVADVVAGSSSSHVLVRTPEVSRLMSVLTAEGAEVSTDVDHALRIRKVSIERIGQLAADNAVVLHELSPQAASLEQAFMELTHDSGEYQTELKPPPPPSTTSAGGPN